MKKFISVLDTFIFEIIIFQHVYSYHYIYIYIYNIILKFKYVLQLIHNDISH